MSRVSNHAFLHGKMHGIYAKSKFDDRLLSLSKLSSLSELSKDLFPSEEIPVADRNLVNTLQIRFEKKNLGLLLGLLALSPEPHPLLVQVVKEYEYRNLKTLVRRKESPIRDMELWDIGKFKSIPATFDGFPAYLAKSPYSQLAEKMTTGTVFELELYLDEQFNRIIAENVRALPSREKILIEPLLKKETILNNLVWALRLRWYYGYSFEETKNLLFTLGYDNIEKLVEQFYSFSLDNPELWSTWKYGWVLGDRQGVKLSPPEAETRVMNYLTRKYSYTFHNNPFTLASIYAFFRLKTMEIRFMKTVSEGIRMNIPSSELAEMLGVEE